MSLKTELQNYIKSQYPRIVSCEEIEQFTKQRKHKMSYAERELRDSVSPEIEKIRNDNGFIVGYKYNNKLSNYKVETNHLSEEYKQWILNKCDEIGTCATMFLIETARDKSLIEEAKQIVRDYEVVDKCT